MEIRQLRVDVKGCICCPHVGRTVRRSVTNRLTHAAHIVRVVTAESDGFNLRNIMPV